MIGCRPASVARYVATLWSILSFAAGARRDAELVMDLGQAGLGWGELSALRVGDRISVPGQGLRLQGAVLASGGTGELFVDSLKGKRSRTVPLV